MLTTDTPLHWRRLSTTYVRYKRPQKAPTVTFSETAIQTTFVFPEINFYQKIVGSIVNNENLEDILVASTRENVSLIKSIPDEYFKKIETIVFTGTTQGSTAGSMIKQIQELNGSTYKRAKLIARDQSSKLNSALTQQRAENIGSEEYVWRTAEDGIRVRETHRKHNGKTFRWDDPPKNTGHPGNDIQCRCIAQPVIKI